MLKSFTLVIVWMFLALFGGLNPCPAESPDFTWNHSLAPAYLQNGNRIYPLRVSIKQADPSRPLQGRILFDARRMNTRQQSFTLRDSTRVVFPLTIADLRNITSSRAGLACIVSGHPMENRKVSITRSMVVHSLFSATDLPMPGLLLKKLYTDLGENENWLQRLTGIAPHLAVDYLDDSYTNLLAEEWPPLLQKIQSSLTQLGEQCQTLKADTLHIIGRPFLPDAAADLDRTGPIVWQWFDQTPQAHFIHDNVETLEKVADKSTEWHDFLTSAIQQGQLEIVGALWSDPAEHLLQGESIIRQILLGHKKLHELFAAGCHIGYSAQIYPQLPQILRQCGYDGLVIPVPPAPPGQSRLLVRGPDGSTIPAVIMSDYREPFSLEEISPLIVANRQAGSHHTALLAPLADTCSWRVYREIDRASALAAFPSLRFSSASDLFHSGLNEKKLGISSAQAMPPNTGPWPFTLSQQLRMCEADLAAADLWAVILRDDRLIVKLDSLRTELLSHQSRGGLSSGRNVFIHRQLTTLQQSLKTILDEKMARLCRPVKTKGKGMPLVVFNSLGWRRSGPVALTLPAGLRVKELRNNDNKPVPFQTAGDTLYFICPDAPSMGYKTFWLQNGERKKPAAPAILAAEQLLENEYLRVEINPGNGQVRRLFDKRSGDELVGMGQTGNRIVAGADENLENRTPCDQVEGIRVLASGPNRAIVRYQLKNESIKVELDYILQQGTPQLEIRVRPTVWRQSASVSAVWPLFFQADSARHGCAFGSVPVALSAEPRALSGLDFLHMHGGGRSMIIATRGYFTCTAASGGLVWDLLSSADLTMQTGDDNSMGMGEIRYILMPGNTRSSAAGVNRRAQECIQPLTARLEEAHAGDQPGEFAFFHSDEDAILLAGVKAPEEGSGWILRLYEAEGKECGDVLISVIEAAHATRVNLLEKEAKPLKSTHGEIHLKVNPFEIVTIKGQ